MKAAAKKKTTKNLIYSDDL